MTFQWTDLNITPDITRIKKKHITEIRDAVQSVQNTLDTHSTSRNQHPVATPSQPGFLSAADKTKLDTIIDVINGAVQAGSVHSVTANAPLVTDNTDPLNPKISLPAASGSVNGYMAKEDKSKLDGIEAGAQVNVPHPANHPPSIIAQDSNNRFITDAERGRIPSSAQINAWNAKQNAVTNATQTTDGLMSAADKKKVDTLDGFPSGTVIMYSKDYSVSNHDISYYFDNSGSPHAIAGGNPFAKWKWLVGMKDRFPIGASSTYPSGNTGGENSFKISSPELPDHAHYFCGDDELLSGVRGTNEAFGDADVTEAAAAGRDTTNLKKYIDYDAKSNGGGGRGYKTREFQKRGSLHNNMPAFMALDFIVKVMD